MEVIPLNGAIYLLPMYDFYHYGQVVLHMDFQIKGVQGEEFNQLLPDL